ncbi:MAG: ankyrin repeat domain-containing protein [Saprospiraceae bacterium]|nr:ankyrin repeat domain-containing protein [Saprospiraceae bacterium]
MSGGDWKAMFKGIQEGDFELVKYYLRTGIDPNYQHPEFMASPLIESIRYNHLDITALLLENGADPKIEEYMGKDTPMVTAKRLKNRKAIKLLNQYLDKKN